MEPKYIVREYPFQVFGNYAIESESGVIICGSQSPDYARNIAAALNAYIPPPVCQHDPLKEHCTLRTYAPIPCGIACIACKKKWHLYPVGEDFK